MEYGQHVQKEVREFLRASDVLLGLLRGVADNPCSANELRLIRGYLSSLKARILAVETAEKLQQSKPLLPPSPEL